MHRFAEFVLAVLSFAILVGCSNEVPKYDPEPYRDEVGAIEALLTQAERQPGDGGKLATLSANLAGAMGANIDNQRRREVVMNLLVMWGEMYSQLDSDDIPWELADAGQDWKKLRDGLFEQASWFEPF